MGPPEEVLPVGPEEKALVKGEEGAELGCGLLDGGRVSQERVRRQDCRIMEKEVEERGSWVDV